MAINKFVPKQYNLTDTNGFLTYSLIPVTSTGGDEVYMINVHNQTTNPTEARIVNEANLNAMIDDMSPVDIKMPPLNQTFGGATNLQEVLNYIDNVFKGIQKIAQIKAGSFNAED